MSPHERINLLFWIKYKDENAILRHPFMWEVIPSTSISSMSLQEKFLGCLKFTKNTFISQFTSKLLVQIASKTINVLQSGKG